LNGTRSNPAELFRDRLQVYCRTPAQPAGLTVD
jgi:hypothetical protein